MPFPVEGSRIVSRWAALSTGVSEKSPVSPSFPHYFDHQSLGPLAIELGIKNLLPRSQVQHAFGDLQDHLMVHHDGCQIRVSGALAIVVIAVISILSCKAVEQDVQILA